LNLSNKEFTLYRCMFSEVVYFSYNDYLYFTTNTNKIYISSGNIVTHYRCISIIEQICMLDKIKAIEKFIKDKKNG